MFTFTNVSCLSQGASTVLGTTDILMKKRVPDPRDPKELDKYMPTSVSVNK